ncbi:MAG: Hsp33 family molecular chaperone HslO [Myxococcota bacterium]
MSGGLLTRGMTADSAVRFLAVDATDAVNEAQRRHGLNAAAARLMGDIMVAGLMMSAYIKGEERLTLQLQADTPRLALICDVDAEGGTRARMTPRSLPASWTGVIDGVLMVIKHNANKELYRGMTGIERADMTHALMRHLTESSQVDALLRLHTELDDAGTVVFSGGLLVERMPPAKDLPHLEPEAFAAHYGAIQRMDAAQIRAAIAEGALLDAPLLVMESRPLTWRCRCSVERIESMLVALGPEELQDMIEKDHGAEVTCHFCNETYAISEDRLTALLALHSA